MYDELLSWMVFTVKRCCLSERIFTSHHHFAHMNVLSYLLAGSFPSSDCSAEIEHSQQPTCVR